MVTASYAPSSTSSFFNKPSSANPNLNPNVGQLTNQLIPSEDIYFQQATQAISQFSQMQRLFESNSLGDSGLMSELQGPIAEMQQAAYEGSLANTKASLVARNSQSVKMLNLVNTTWSKPYIGMGNSGGGGF